MKRLPIGISDYKEVIENGYAYVDKTLLIQEIIEFGTKVAILPRPRRFGKTINLSMLRYFFEKTEQPGFIPFFKKLFGLNTESNSHLFKSFKIWQTPYRKFQGRFPVVFITFKDIKSSTWEHAYIELKKLISKEFERHQYLLNKKTLSENEQKQFLAILDGSGDFVLFKTSLQTLTLWLNKFHKKKVIVLIDEYDTPIHAAYLESYYQSMIEFMQGWLSGGLKDNSSLEKSVITGILRISKESIFSGFNNTSSFSLLNERFGDKFGLLEKEVIDLLNEQGTFYHIEEIRRWYNGYRIGNHFIYNPWSILECINNQGELKPYWINTSNNGLIKKLLLQGGADFKQDLESLLQGEVITKSINEGIIFKDLETQENAVWGLFLFSGYLTLNSKPIFEGDLNCQLKIPNEEIQFLYKTIIKEWLLSDLKSSNLTPLLKSLTTGDIDTFSQIFQGFLLNALSFYDTAGAEPEKVYHAFVLGLLVTLEKTHEIKSNRESGFGRYDVMLIPKDSSALGICMEFKKAQEHEDLETVAINALKQIEEKKYNRELQNRGIQDILHLGFAFQGKKVLIKQVRI